MILVIGGTSGIGYETANHLNNEGYEVLICGRNRPKNCELNYNYIDVTDENSIKELFKDIKQIDGIVYCAGITTKQKKIDMFDKEIYNNIMDVNVTGLLLSLKYGYNLLKKNPSRIVVVNSLAGRTFSQFSGIEYTISKTALSGLVKHLSIDFAKDNILINSVFPSMTATPMLVDNVEQKLLNDIEKSIPLNRIAQPSEIAEAIEFLISSRNTYMTGSGLDINGGQFLNG